MQESVTAGPVKMASESIPPIISSVYISNNRFIQKKSIFRKGGINEQYFEALDKLKNTTASSCACRKIKKKKRFHLY